MWRTSERSGSGPDTTSVAPLTRYRTLTAEAPTPVIRTAATMDVVGDPIDAESRCSHSPPRVAALSGWRASFSSDTPADIGRALAKPRARFRGPRLAAGATAIRIWGRAPVHSAVTVRLLTDGQFGVLPIGGIGPDWRRVRAAVPRGLRGAMLASIEVGGSLASRPPARTSHRCNSVWPAAAGRR